MTLRINWDDYEVIEAEGYTRAELEDTMEEVQEVMSVFWWSDREHPLELDELMEKLDKMEADLYATD